jgi:hypothetical protein
MPIKKGMTKAKIKAANVGNTKTGKNLISAFCKQTTPFPLNMPPWRIGASPSMAPAALTPPG